MLAKTMISALALVVLAAFPAVAQIRPPDCSCEYCLSWEGQERQECYDSGIILMHCRDWLEDNLCFEDPEPSSSSLLIPNPSASSCAPETETAESPAEPGDTPQAPEPAGL